MVSFSLCLSTRNKIAVTTTGQRNDESKAPLGGNLGERDRERQRETERERERAKERDRERERERSGTNKRS